MLRSAYIHVSCRLFLGGLLVSCQSSLPPAEYNAYLTNPANGLTHAIEVNGVTVTCTYRPTDLLVQQELVRLPAPSPALRDSLAHSYAGKTYCSLTLARHSTEIENQFINDPASYQQLLIYLNTGIAADAFLVTSSRDSVAAAASMYVRRFGTTGRSTVLLVFNTPHRAPSQGFWLTLRGQQLGLGTLRFQFTGADLAALPALRLP